MSPLPRLDLSQGRRFVLMRVFLLFIMTVSRQLALLMKHIPRTVLLAWVIALASLAATLPESAAKAQANAPPSIDPRFCLPADDAPVAELAELAAAVDILRQTPLLDGYFGRLLSECEPNICIDPTTIDCRGYFEPEKHVIAVGGALSRLEMTLIVAHELRHLDQYRRGYGPSLAIDMSENVRLSFAMEADAQAIATLFAWSASDSGDPALWRALEGLEHSEDIAAAFVDAITAGATPAGATRTAFSAWYRSSWRLERYRTAAAGSHLDRLDAEKAIPTAARLPPDHFDNICLMPDGSNYGCHLTEEIEMRGETSR